MSRLDEQMPILWALTFECPQCGAWWKCGAYTQEDQTCERCGADVSPVDGKQLTLSKGR